jgi:hypothetical protein
MCFHLHNDGKRRPVQFEENNLPHQGNRFQVGRYVICSFSKIIYKKL